MPFTTPTKSLAIGVDFVPPKNWDAVLWKLPEISYLERYQCIYR
jgi:hypothetical protein